MTDHKLHDLTSKILEIGIDKCLFMVPMKPIRTAFGFFPHTSSNDPDYIVPATITESKYKVADDYKITLKATNELFGQQHFYVSDLHHMIVDNQVEMFINAKTVI
ncbi:MAG: hypothetical protein WC979_02940 [Candidatus Pacearchaeota archaeon]|jgi:hypothetical protein|nr:hypothetical protein [Clostridia bacterium]